MLISAMAYTTTLTCWHCWLVSKEYHLVDSYRLVFIFLNLLGTITISYCSHLFSLFWTQTKMLMSWWSKNLPAWFHERILARYGVCTRNQLIIRCFISSYFQLKVNDILWKLKKTLFWVHFELFLPILRRELFFKICFCHFPLSKFLSLCKIFAKTDEQIPRKTGHTHTEKHKCPKGAPLK